MGVEKQRTFFEFEIDIDSGRHLDVRAMHPRSPGIAPRTNSEMPQAHGVGANRARPAIEAGAGGVQARGRGDRAVRAGEHHLDPQGVVTLAEAGSGNRDELAHGRGCRQASAEHTGGDIGDREPAGELTRQ